MPADARCQVELPNIYGKKHAPVCGRRALASGYCRMHAPDVLEVKAQKRAAMLGGTGAKP